MLLVTLLLNKSTIHVSPLTRLTPDLQDILEIYAKANYKLCLFFQHMNCYATGFLFHQQHACVCKWQGGITHSHNTYDVGTGAKRQQLLSKMQSAIAHTDNDALSECIFDCIRAKIDLSGSFDDHKNSLLHCLIVHDKPAYLLDIALRNFHNLAVNQHNFFGQTAYQLALSKGNCVAMSILQKYGADMKPPESTPSVYEELMEAIDRSLTLTTGESFADLSCLC